MIFQQPQWLWLLVPLGLFWWHFLASQSRLRWWRLGMGILLIVALADPRFAGQSTRHRVGLLLDRSLSVRGEGLARGESIAQTLAARYPEQELAVVGFGRGAGLLVPPGGVLEGISHLAGQDESNLAAGIRLAAGIGGGAGSHSLLLVSDGLATGADPLLEIPALRKEGIRLHYLPLASHWQNDTALVRLQNPSRSTIGQPFMVAFEIVSPKEQPAEIRWQNRQGQVLLQKQVQLQAGTNRFSFPWREVHTGLHEYRLHLSVAADEIPENNVARAVIDIMGPPQVLVLNRTGQPTALSRALMQAGVNVETSDGGQGIHSARLKHYQMVVLENMPLDRLNDEADTALAHYVRHLGGGLLVTGGRSSYALGGYFRSDLEALLPVIMDRKEELRRSRLAMAIVMDRSGSMAVAVEEGAVKMDLANRGAAEAIALLSSQDELAVFAVDSTAHTVISRQAIGDATHREALVKKVLSVESMGGGIYVYEGLSAAMESLLTSAAPNRHIILFTDAADSEQPGEYVSLVQKWHAVGGTLSVIGLGTAQDSDADLLQDIARIGGGQVYFTANALKLPRVFTQDVMRVARKTFIEREVKIRPASGLATLQFRPKSYPTVVGYNLANLAPEAELLLWAEDEGRPPIAAAWQRGQGKVFALLVEADGPYSGKLVTWPAYKRLFRQILEWLKQGDRSEGFAANLRLQGREGIVSLQLEPGTSLNVPAQALIIPPGEKLPIELPLHWQGPNRLSARFPMASDGVYHGAIRIPGKSSLLLPPRVLPYSPEFAPRSNYGAGEPTLARLASATGGQLYTHIDQLAQIHPSRPTQDRSLLVWWVALILSMLLVDIAYRRGLLDPGLHWLIVRWDSLWKWFLGTIGQLRTKPEPTPPVVPIVVVDAEEEADPLTQAKKKARRGTNS